MECRFDAYSQLLQLPKGLFCLRDKRPEDITGQQPKDQTQIDHSIHFHPVHQFLSASHQSKFHVAGSKSH